MKKLGFVGGGNMAEALIGGLIAAKLFKPSDLIASDVAPARRRTLSRRYRIATSADNREVAREASALLLAVKPQQIDSVMAELRDAINQDRRAKSRLVISIAAGVTIARIAAALGACARVIRVMPNAPAMVGEGMAAIVLGDRATRADLKFALNLFGSVGDAVALPDESMLDAVTALSGSGPAYVYLFVKSMCEAAAKEGLPAPLAMRMALKTVAGAERMMRMSKQDVDQLIRTVASPGGTTEAALRRLAQAGFSDIVASALRAAAARSRELGRC